MKMIKSIRHRGLKAYYTKGQTKGLNADHLIRIDRYLDALAVSTAPDDINLPGTGFHALTGDRKGQYSLRITANLRMVFEWDDEAGAVINIDLVDYH